MQMNGHRCDPFAPSFDQLALEFSLRGEQVERETTLGVSIKR
jgi:hypothetical protein